MQPGRPQRAADALADLNTALVVASNVAKCQAKLAILQGILQVLPVVETVTDDAGLLAAGRMLLLAHFLDAL
jgi:hypothetical protein